MMIACLTLDEVNLSLARLFAERNGDRLREWHPKDGPPHGRFHALIYDLDHWVSDRQEFRKLVQALSTTPLDRPIAVLSGNLDDAEVQDLQANQVLVFPRLSAELFEQLEQAVAADAERHDRDEQTAPVTQG